MPEYLGRRFGGYRMRIYLSCVALSLYVLTKVSVSYGIYLFIWKNDNKHWQSSFLFFIFLSFFIYVCICVCVCVWVCGCDCEWVSVSVASLMVADVIPPTLSRTNSPTSEHNDYPFKSFNTHTTLPITRKTHAIHTYDLSKAYKRKILIKSFAIHHDISQPWRTILRQWSDHQLVKESTIDTVPQTLYNSSIARAHSAKSTYQ